VDTKTQAAFVPLAATPARNSALGILFALSFCHLLNDSVQALLPAIYPLLKNVILSSD